jgi:FKBP-type peptidyl-prolyl cis-trans isomerase 2
VELGDVVTVHYRIAHLPDPGPGIEDFLLTDPHGKRMVGLLEDTWLSESPVTFTAGAAQVLHGIDEGVIGMRIAEERALDIPAAMAFGDRGHRDTVPPGARLAVLLYLVTRIKASEIGVAG